MVNSTNQEPTLSICVCVKNRSRIPSDGKTLPLFPNCVQSLVSAANEINGTVELVIADFDSDDWPLNQWLSELSVGLETKVIQMQGSFSRGRGINTAVNFAGSSKIFLCDADILVSGNALKQGLKIVDEGKSWFPICHCLDAAGQPESWRKFGKGLAFVSRQTFDQAGGLPEFESWGGEDKVFYGRTKRLTKIVRNRCEDLLHQWHPNTCRTENYQNKKRKSDYKKFRLREK